MSAPAYLTGHDLTVDGVRELQDQRVRLHLAPAAAQRVAASRRTLETLLGDGRLYYGINTGFGILATTQISTSDVAQLQQNLIHSHAVGVGPEVPEEIARLMLLLKINALAQGLSGVRPTLVEYLLAFWNGRVTPVIRSKGSLGASGDLAPLAHLTLPLLGQGEVNTPEGRCAAAGALTKLNLPPLRLTAKEGLALINGTQFMAAYAVHALLRIANVLKAADLAAAMTLEALRGSAVPFDARIHAARPHAGARESAENVRRLLESSEILPSHRNCGKVQDPYSLRCAPQVHGAARDAVRHARQVVEIEINSATDNPLILPEGEVLNGGNFHGEPLALALDYLAIAVAEIASISERRQYLLLGGDTTGDIKVPKFLTRSPGLNSGFMLLQYTAAALVSENKVLAHPAAVDSIPSSLGQEDHVSMGAISATKLLTIVENAETVLALELLGAAQALDFLRPLAAGRGVEAAHARIRREITFHEADRLMYPEIDTAVRLLRSGAFVAAAEGAAGALR